MACSSTWASQTRIGHFIDHYNFLRPRKGCDGLVQARHWLASTANVRIHGTIGRRPCDLLAEEQKTLAAYDSLPAYRFIDPAPQQVSWESLVAFPGSLSISSISSSLLANLSQKPHGVPRAEEQR